MDAKPSTRKFAIALALYCLLAIVGWFTLSGNIRLFMFILLGAMALKTWIARAAGW
jgi:hypothetical protein